MNGKRYNGVRPAKSKEEAQIEEELRELQKLLARMREGQTGRGPKES